VQAYVLTMPKSSNKAFEQLIAFHYKKTHTLEFTPDEDFIKKVNLPIHDIKAYKGLYNKKHNQATINIKGKKFFFTNVVQDRNPKLSGKKYQGKKFIKLGYYTKRFNRQMPVIMYLHGQLQQLQ
jgi:hypothetical protein